MFIADRRLYVTADRSRVVEEDDPEAAFLLAAVGTRVPDAEAKRLGLLDAGDETAAAELGAKEKRPAGTKVRYPKGTKAQEPPAEER